MVRRSRLVFPLIVAMVLTVAGAAAIAQAVPNERLLNKDLAVYRRSATELWVYDSRPEAGVGSHQMDSQTLDLICKMGVRLVRHTMYWNLIETTDTPGRYDPKALAQWDDIIVRC